MEEYFGIKSSDEKDKIRFCIAKCLDYYIDEERSKVKPENLQRFYTKILKMLQNQDKFVKFMMYKQNQYIYDKNNSDIEDEEKKY
ncbi:hypothetical protein [uncultured archaeal virus]|uniref:Uncharacterized protein n=1 Tax=uncultured archaeal virus TaxID=1960247 RepID=A0A8B0LS61_9VIRU|nr:hypothetical protein [uncultured archaeal virus]